MVLAFHSLAILALLPLRRDSTRKSTSRKLISSKLLVGEGYQMHACMPHMCVQGAAWRARASAPAPQLV